MKHFTLLPYLLIFVFLSCKKPEPFQFKGLENFTVHSIATDSATISSDVVFYNPNAFSVELKNIEADFYANDNLLAHHLIDTLITVPASAETKVPVTMRVSLQPIINNALTMFLNKQVMIRAKGKTQIGHSGIYITVPFEFSKNQEINLF